MIDEFELDITKIKKVFEFGGGYGCMARIFSLINKDIKYFCFDTFYVNLLQFYYLKYNNLDVGFSKKKKFFLNSNLNKIGNFFNNKNDSLFIANWSISETPINKGLLFSITHPRGDIDVSQDENAYNPSMVLSGDTPVGKCIKISTSLAVLSSIFLILILPLSFAFKIESISDDVVVEKGI